MRKLLCFAFVFLSAFAFGQTTAVVTGTLVDQSETGTSSGISVDVTLVNTGSQRCFVNGTGTVVTEKKNYTAAQILAGITLAKTANITCGASSGQTRWRFSFKNSALNTSRDCDLQISAATSLNTATCLQATTTPTTTVPTSSLFWLLDGSNSPTGNLVPAVNGTQSIGTSGSRWNMFAATMDVSGNETVGGTLGVAGIQTNTNANGVRYVTGFSGTGTTQINNAENDLGSTNGLVWTPGTVACGAGQNLALKDNIFVFDFRTCSSAQQQGTNLLFNVKDTNNGAVRDKLMLVDPFTPANVMSAASSSASLYSHTFLEGNLATFATLEAINGTITVDTGATNSPTVVIGIEGEASVSGTTANTVTDVRGGTFNVGLTGAGNIGTATALRAQSVTNTGSGIISNAFGFVCEDQTVGTVSNLCIWSNGKAAFDKPVSFGSFGGGIVPQAATMIFVRPQSGQLTGGTQTGLQVAPITSSSATSTGIGILSRSDLGSAFTQGQNTAFEAQTPSLNGGTITRYTAFKADAPPVAGTLCLYEFGGATSGSSCLNAPSTGGVTNVLPSTAGTLTVTVGSGTAVMTTAGIVTGACGTTVTVASTNVLTTDTINFARNAAATIGNGGGLTLNAWPTAGNVNFNYCNSAAGTITPTAMTINWNVTR